MKIKEAAEIHFSNFSIDYKCVTRIGQLQRRPKDFGFMTNYDQ